MSDTQAFNPHDLELFGAPLNNIAEALRTGLFAGSTLDVFMDNIHYRIENVRFTLQGESLKFDAKLKAKRFSQGAWLPAPKFVLDAHFYGQAAVMMTHTDERGRDGKRKLKFVSFSQQAAGGKRIQMVLYRSGYRPQKADLQILGWHDEVNPVIGGAAVAKQKH